MQKTILENTLKHDLCINCGICKTVCPESAISLNSNKYGELIPYIDKDKCTNCGICTRFCPNTYEKIKDEAKKISAIEEPCTFGLENSKYYVAWDDSEIQRLKCCSGGAVTKLASYLLENKLIDGMIHVERLWSKLGEQHYSARLSKTIQEIQENVSSAYQPIDFSNILENLEKGKTYFITGTPCIIRGIKKLFDKNKKFKDIDIITCALICSHNTNSQFIDYLTQINNLGISKTEEWQANIRYKDSSISDANNFKNHIYTKDKTLLLKNRYESGWTHIWRSYFFAMNCCNYCSDFWGYEADVSVKDAWGKWAKEDNRGKSIVIIRNEQINELFLKCGLIFEELSFDVMKKHQKKTSEYKQNQTYNKNFKSIFSKPNRENGLLKNVLVAKSSKYLYKTFGYNITRIIMPIIELFCNLGSKL